MDLNIVQLALLDEQAHLLQVGREETNPVNYLRVLLIHHKFSNFGLINK